MREWKQELIQILAMGIGIPAILVSIVIVRGNRENTQVPSGSEPTTSQTTQPQLQKIQIPVLNGERYVEMDLEEYLLGVLLAEMPASFDAEALKAQAVAARTFTLRCHVMGGNHALAAVCMEPTCCQGYLSPLRYIQQGGSVAQMERLRGILAETAGEVVCYEGEVILASYFSCSGGSTESALAVWGQDYPYLQPVESPGEEDAAFFTDQKVFTISEFEEALNISLKGVPGSWFGVLTYTQGGGVKTADICGITYQGVELRNKLGLRSTVFTFSASEDTITVYTRGYGHRVGLSQYGAEAMAVSGKDYRSILAHYYPGTVVQMYSGE